MKYSFSTTSRLFLKRAVFAAVFVPYNLVLTVLVSLWMIAVGVGFGSVRRLTTPRRWVWYPTFRSVSGSPGKTRELPA